MAEATIKTKYKILRVMLRNNVNLSNAEEVKLFIAKNKNWSNGHKIIAVYAYNDYAKIAHCFLEIMPLIHPAVIKMAYSNVKEKSKIGFAEFLTLAVSQTAVGMDIETAKKLTATLKKYPNEYAQLKMAIQLMIDQLSQLIAE